LFKTLLQCSNWLLDALAVVYVLNNNLWTWAKSCHQTAPRYLRFIFPLYRGSYSSYKSCVVHYCNSFIHSLILLLWRAWPWLMYCVKTVYRSNRPAIQGEKDSSC